MGKEMHEAHPGAGNPDFWNKPTGDRFYKKPIKFEKPFEKPPEVIVSLSNLGIMSGRNTRVKVEAKNITATGFELEYMTWSDSITDRIGVNWMAIDKDVLSTSSPV